jgi:hypothetical protein
VSGLRICKGVRLRRDGRPLPDRDDIETAARIAHRSLRTCTPHEAPSRSASRGRGSASPPGTASPCSRSRRPAKPERPRNSFAEADDTAPVSEVVHVFLVEGARHDVANPHPAPHLHLGDHFIGVGRLGRQGRGGPGARQGEEQDQALELRHPAIHRTRRPPRRPCRL